MSEPTRYAMNLYYAQEGGVSDARMVPHSTGQYIEYSDYDALRIHAESLYEALEVFADDDPCDFDHHGYCQAHDFLGPEPGCGVADAHKILDAYRAAYPKEDT